AAPVMAAHGAEVGVHIEVFVMEGAGGIRIEGELEVLLPVECGAGPGQFVVSVPRARNAEGHVGGMSRDLVGDAALLDVILLGQAQVLFRGDVAEHAGPVKPGSRRSNAARDVIVSGEDVRY